MARVGEGDPRWIVEERDDSVNVNNWHWTERDVLGWSKDRMKALLGNISHTSADLNWNVKNVATDGVATLSVRKGRLRQIFDLELSIEFEATYKEVSYKGKIIINEFSKDLNLDDLEIEIDFFSETYCKELSDGIKNSSRIYLKKAFENYSKALELECTKGLILPSKNDSKEQKIELSFDLKSSDVSKVEVKNSPIRTGHAELNITENMLLDVSEVYVNFTVAERIMSYTRASALMEKKVGGKFHFLDNSIEGIIQKMEENKYLEWKWRLKAWPSGHYSLVKIYFSTPSKGSCKIEIKHTDIVAHDLERVEAGWNRAFLNPIKKLYNINVD